MASLSKEESTRYSRHLVLKDFGLENQLKLKEAKVLVVGAGGLGSPALLYLTAAGVGTLGIVDFDNVDITNLQRQVIFTQEDVGKNKAIAAARRLQLLNPLITVNPLTVRLSTENAKAIVDQYDIVLDGTDNFATRYLINDVCVLLNKPLVYGSILEFEGQVASFNVKNSKGEWSSNYRDLFPQPPSPESVLNCEQAGVLGVLPGMIGSMQALEVIKIVTGIGKPLIDKLAILDGLDLQLTIIKIKNTNARAYITGLIDYDDFCGLTQQKSKYLNIDKNNAMKEVTVQELEKLKEGGADFQLIDVREPHEFDICDIGGELIPMGDIPHNVDKISKDKQVIIHCRSGKRSGDIVNWLEKNHGFQNLYNLKGGILSWIKEIDPTLPAY